MFFHVKQMTKNLAVDPKDYGPGLVDTIKRKLVMEVVPRSSIRRPSRRAPEPARHPPLSANSPHHFLSSRTFFGLVRHSLPEHHAADQLVLPSTPGSRWQDPVAGLSRVRSATTGQRT